MMAEYFVHVGLGNYVRVSKIIAIASPDSSPLRRMFKLAKDSNKLIELNFGRKVRSLLFLDNSVIISSHLRPLAILKRALPLEFLRKHLEKYEEEEVKEEGRKLRKAIDALEEIERE